ncbi:(2Fe-2S)-binding protein [Caminibacter mediatlanticus]|uniref:Bifunctional 3,4-dihydroxy-2-butanone 4-phosphate synthase/GTP cyclohydrolase II protein n=1 Tax=Caminibacter mediatlanticus TB-2 TaxID=391592 RepID=A0AAI9AGI7_9BACT|nr:(2Fe-2S)-binding protein [Caminibacter mediatlanticus]EDM23079.1 bifunctional 3,4-dihydroxy-2-butanone 4-phosphate synthase/GTP cyclohydrolase II protein [Caminibacter mediatlanticus TB-2]
MSFNDLASIDDLYVVCYCEDVNFGEIMKVIKSGVCDLEKIIEITGAGKGCGKCISPENDPAGERAIHLTEIIELAKAEGYCK